MVTHFASVSFSLTKLFAGHPPSISHASSGVVCSFTLPLLLNVMQVHKEPKIASVSKSQKEESGIERKRENFDPLTVKIKDK